MKRQNLCKYEGKGRKEKDLYEIVCIISNECAILEYLQ